MRWRWLIAGILFSVCQQSCISNIFKSKQDRAEDAVKKYCNFDKNKKRFAHTWFTKVQELQNSGYTIGIVDTNSFKGGDRTWWFMLDTNFHVEGEYTN